MVCVLCQGRAAFCFLPRKTIVRVAPPGGLPFLTKQQLDLPGLGVGSGEALETFPHAQVMPQRLVRPSREKRRARVCCGRCPVEGSA